MSFTISGSDAANITPFVGTNDALAELVPGYEYDTEPSDPVVALVDQGNQLCYVLDGPLPYVESMANLLRQAVVDYQFKKA